jgi:tetratricopeptide (TPR) repeat protein
MLARNESGKALQVVLIVLASVLGLLAAGVVAARMTIDADRISEDAKHQLDDYTGRTDQLVHTLATLRIAVAVHPESAPAWAQLARVARKFAYRGGDAYDPEVIAQSHKFAQRALEIDPHCYAALYAESYTYLVVTDIANAEGYAARMQEIQPASRDTHLMWATVRIKERRFDDAKQHMEAALQADPGPGTRGVVVDDQMEIATAYGDWAAVDSCHRALIDLQPTNAWARGNYSNFLIDHERYDDAIVWADSAIAIMDYPMAHRYLAVARFWRGLEWIRSDGRWKDANEEFRTATVDDPSCAMGWYGIAYVDRGRYETSNKPQYLASSNAALERAKKLDPTWKAIDDLAAMNAGNGQNLTR